MLPYYLKIGDFKLPSYGTLIAIGIIFATYFSAKNADRKIKKLYPNMNIKDLKIKLPTSNNIIDLVLVAVISGIIGGKLLYIIPNFKNIITNFNIKDAISAGFVIYGAIIGGAIGIYIYCRFKDLDFLSCLDNFVPFVAMAQGFGRIGCLMAGCCYGKPTSSIGIVFKSEFSMAPTGIKLFPTQLISSIGNFCIFIILLIITKYILRRGFVTAIYMLLYSIGRFIIEFYRGDNIRGFVGVLSTSQFISIFIFILGLILMILSIKDLKNPLDIDIIK